MNKRKPIIYTLKSGLDYGKSNPSELTDVTSPC